VVKKNGITISEFVCLGIEPLLPREVDHGLLRGDADDDVTWLVGWVGLVVGQRAATVPRRSPSMHRRGRPHNLSLVPRLCWWW
jgi:hypothetical protein